MYQNVVARLVVIWALVACALAFPSPTTPIGDTVWNVGDDVEIRWRDSGLDPKSSSLSGINIYFMTGPNIGQIKLAPIAENLDKDATSAKWTVPELKQFGFPAGNIYFIMFTDSKDPNFGISWSTRFRVLDGSEEVSYDPKDPWPYGTGGSSTGGNQTDTNDTGDSNDTDTTTDDNTDDAAATADTDDTDDTDNTNSTNDTDGGTTTIRSGPTPTPNNVPDDGGNAGNTAPRFIPTVTLFVTVVVMVVAAAFLA